MSKHEKMEAEALKNAVSELEGWELVEGKLHRKFKFDNFSAAFAFMTRVAMDAHLLDHHPEWSNVYNQVTIDLVTHSAGGITDLDFDLASRVNSYLD